MKLCLERVVDRFPFQGAAIRRLALRDSAFRGMCDDYHAACASLAWYQSAEDARRQPEIDEFTDLVLELEREIAEALDRVRS